MIALAISLAFAAFGSFSSARSLASQSFDDRQVSSCENTATSRGCWGEYDINTDYYEVTPDTGATKEVCFSIFKFHI